MEPVKNETSMEKLRDVKRIFSEQLNYIFKDGKYDSFNIKDKNMLCFQNHKHVLYIDEDTNDKTHKNNDMLLISKTPGKNNKVYVDYTYCKNNE